MIDVEMVRRVVCVFHQRSDDLDDLIEERETTVLHTLTQCFRFGTSAFGHKAIIRQDQL